MNRSFLFFCLMSIMLWLHPSVGFTHPAVELYNQASSLVNQNKLSSAREKFHQVQLMYPFSSFAIKAQLMSSFISYANHNYVISVLDSEKYIKMYPRSKDIQYVYYLRAMACYQQIGAVERDSSMAQNALGAFDDIIKKFPNSEYGKAADMKYNEVLNYLAAKEMNIGLFYLRKANYTPAIKRFIGIISNYYNTDYVTEATYRLVEIFHAIGLTQEAKYYADKLN